MTGASPASAVAGTASAGLGPVDWVSIARGIAASGKRAVLALIVSAAGSAPRAEGTWLVVTAGETFGTLGGGELERIATMQARERIAGTGAWERALVDRILGPDLGQCCGGKVRYLFEPIDASALIWLDDLATGLGESGGGMLDIPLADPAHPPAFDPKRTEAPPPVRGKEAPEILSLLLRDPRPHVVIFGAGHVGRTFAAFSAWLPIRVHVVDDRKEMLAHVAPAPNVTPVFETVPEEYAGKSAPIDAAFVMTYSHELDFALSRALLARPEIRYVGMIGSKSKAARARKQIVGAGLAETLPRFVSPIGIDGPPGKEPGVIALGALAEVLRILRGIDEPD